MSKGYADRTKDRKAYDRNHDAIKWPSKGKKKGCDSWDRCSCCGCFLEISGDWVGDSHYDAFANAVCNNPKCKSNKKGKATK